MNADRLLPWLLRLLWGVLPFTVGAVLGDALGGWSPTPRTVAAILAWGAWATVLCATLVPHPASLTALRIVAPAALVAIVGAALDGHGDALAAASAGAAVVVAFLPAIGEQFVNGSAYPNERRLPLRVPGPLLLGPLPLAWALAVCGATIGPLLLADARWVPGGVAAAIGLPLAVLLVRAMHGLARRWIVFVPAGVVLHDAQALADPVLFRRDVVEALRPAAADTDSLDLTKHATGLALELVLLEKVPLVLTTPGNRAGESGSSARLLFTPVRPGEVVAEARARRIRTT